MISARQDVRATGVRLGDHAHSLRCEHLAEDGQHLPGSGVIDTALPLYQAGLVHRPDPIQDDLPPLPAKI
jgi:hypothetical protein